MGQSGFLSAALLTGGLRLSATRPVLSGIMFGLLSYKPQLGFLVPIVLVAAGLWQAFIAACLTVSVLAVAAVLVFAWGAWTAWVGMLPAYAGLFDASAVVAKMPIVLANLRMLGASPMIAILGQALPPLLSHDTSGETRDHLQTPRS